MTAARPPQPGDTIHVAYEVTESTLPPDPRYVPVRDPLTGRRSLIRAERVAAVTPARTDSDLITAALAELGQVPVLPDAGRHRDPDCHRRDIDCLALHISRILKGEAQ